MSRNSSFCVNFSHNRVAPFNSELSTCLYMEGVKVLFLKLLFLFHTFLFFLRYYFIYYLPFISIASLLILYKPVHFYLISFIFLTPIIWVFLVFPAELIFFLLFSYGLYFLVIFFVISASSYFTSCCLAKYFLNYYISVSYFVFFFELLFLN